MTRQQKLSLAKKLMDIEMDASPVTGSRTSMKAGTIMLQQGASKKFSLGEKQKIHAFYNSGKTYIIQKKHRRVSIAAEAAVVVKRAAAASTKKK